MTLARVVSVLVVTSLALLAGCSGKIVGTDLTSKPDPTDPTNPTDPTDPTDPGRCTTIAPTCDKGDTSFSSDKSCNASGAAYCYSRTETCNNLVIWCGHLDAQCDGRPECELGDSQVTACPSGGPANNNVCYPRTVCGTTILCFHRGTCTDLPQCDPGDAQVVDPTTCKSPAALCYSRFLCGVTITCSR